MDHVAIDLGGRESQICVRSADGSILEEKRVATTGLQKVLGEETEQRVVVETCAEAFRVADDARELGHEVKVVPASLARSLGVGSRGVKNDIRDSRNLSEASCRMSRLPSVHVPSPAARAAKALCGLRDGLVHSRTLLINTVRGWLRTQGRRLPTGSMATFSTRVRTVCGDALPGYVARQLTALDDLQPHIAAADQEVRALAHADAVAQRLMTVPGVGPVTAVRFIAALDDPTRFASGHAVAAYLGLGGRAALHGRTHAASGHHQGRQSRRAVVSGAGRAVCAPDAAAQSAAGVGGGNRPAARPTGRDRGSGAQTGGHPVCAVARRQHLRSVPQQHATATAAAALRRAACRRGGPPAIDGESRVGTWRARLDPRRADVRPRHRSNLLRPPSANTRVEQCVSSRDPRRRLHRPPTMLRIASGRICP